ncbi:HDIG domain-containing protein [Clostridium bovifaecis]|uniref:HDIG domain-containing protein n=1 Tax=Clostridium bovifaecis TaxID=2184719 RepID=A0A6I6EYW0_9CLOT|nr:HDIG domain-containing protein [Clostridium bovifaecis]
MTSYRIKQFYWGITAKISLEDKGFLKEYLNDNELKLFSRLPIYDQAHCIRTAKEVKRVYLKNRMSNNLLIKAALLHDIGKIEGRLNLIDKSVLVVLDKLTKGKIRRFNNVKKIDVYYNHANKGYSILKEYNYNERFLYLIKNHHNNIIRDKELEILRECDCKS